VGWHDRISSLNLERKSEAGVVFILRWLLTRMSGSLGGGSILVAVRLRLSETHLSAGQGGQLVEADVRPVYVRPGQRVGLRVAAAQGNRALAECPMPGSCLVWMGRYFYTDSLLLGQVQ